MSPLPSADRWKTLEPLIDAAIELAPEARPAFVRDACGGDAELAAELTRLLAEYERRDTLIDSPAAERFSSLADEEMRIPELLGGRYRIERELGRGGMASVHLARDLAHDRHVAVKVLRSDLTAAVGAGRFLAEIRVTAKLQHPHILSLHDSGEADGLLYYVMPYVEGESLRQRLQRERRLPIAEATRIACEVASALDAAHHQGVVHRDIKPENILFSAGQALVADFGIALALSDAGERLTKSGLALGTPQYMSPEQATGDAPIDRRTDVYALGTLMFEMLAGEPPFTGTTVSAVLAKRAAMPAPPVRVLRAAVPPQMDAAVARALAREVVDRYDTVGEFAEALKRSLASSGDALDDTGAARVERAAGSVRRPRRWAVAAIVAIAATLGIGAFAMRRDTSVPPTGAFSALLQGIGLLPASLDTFSYVVIGDRAPAGAASPDVAEPLRNALRRWQELRVPDAESITTQETTSSPAVVARRMATSLRAGRYVRMYVAKADDSLDVSADLFDTKSDARLGTARVRIPSGRAIAEAAMDSLSNALLFREIMPRVARPEGAVRTASLAARSAFLRGQLALERGSLVRADSEFHIAAEADPRYAQAIVWQAQVRSWIWSRDRPWAQLPQRAAQAVAERGSLAPADSALLVALRALADGRPEEACPAWARLTRVTAYDFAAWYGLANCLRRDPAVVRDSRGTSPWHFRSSYAQALRAYREAFRLQPSLLHGFGGRSLTELQKILYTSSATTRFGRATRPDTQSFLGIPIWTGDSLSFLPVTAEAARLASLPAAVGVAIQRQRESFLEIARMWRSEFPSDANAAEAVSVALAMLGDRTAVDTLRLARALATARDDGLRIAAAEVFIHLKFSLPDDRSGIRAAWALADSVLKAQQPGEQRGAQALAALAALAALTGRAQLAASYATAGGLDDPPPAIAASGPALLTYASLGGGADSLRVLEEQVERGIESLPESDRERYRNAWSWRAATLAFPDYHLRTLSSAQRSGNPDAIVVGAAARGDADAVRRGLMQIKDARRLMRPEDGTLDGVFPESAALWTIGDYRGAAEWLDPVLVALRSSSAQDLANVARAGPLVRTLVLRAKLAERLGDMPTARRFAAAVVVLWSEADPFLQETVRRMEALAR